MPAVIKKLRKRRKAINDLTRMLSAVEDGARAGRPWAPRRERVSLGRAL
jgi:hypothetical protein